MVCWTRFEHSSVHPQEDLYMQLYGYKQLRTFRWRLMPPSSGLGSLSLLW